MEQFFSVLCFFIWLIFSKVLRNPDFHADKMKPYKSQNDLNAACYFLTIQFSVLIDHILVQEKEIASSLRQPANHTRDNQLIRLSKISQKCHKKNVRISAQKSKKWSNQRKTFYYTNSHRLELLE